MLVLLEFSSSSIFFAAGFENFGIRQFHEELLHRLAPTQFVEFSERLESDGVEGARLSHLGVRASRLGIKHDEDQEQGGDSLQEQGFVQLDRLQREDNRDLSLHRYLGPPRGRGLRSGSIGKVEGRFSNILDH